MGCQGLGVELTPRLAAHKYTRAFRLLLVLCLASFGCPAALAGDGAHLVEVFAISGVLASGNRLSGTVTIDSTAGTVIAADVKVSDDLSLRFDEVGVQSSRGPAYIVHIAPHGEACPVFVFGERTSPASLQGYNGGPLGPNTGVTNCDGTADFVLYAVLTLVPG